MGYNNYDTELNSDCGYKQQVTAFECKYFSYIISTFTGKMAPC
jgi:hypothetical protein